MLLCHRYQAVAYIEATAMIYQDDKVNPYLTVSIIASDGNTIKHLLSDTFFFIKLALKYKLIKYVNV